MANTHVIRDATCTFCGCVCDDMHLTVDNDTHKIVKAENACVLGRAWFKEHGIEQRPFALIDGREASTDEAIDAAARILADARFPITGFFGDFDSRSGLTVCGIAAMRW